jgi:hypothetical protein
MPFAWDVACDDRGFVLSWRMGTRLVIARRALDHEASWTTPTVVADDVSSLGRAGQVGAHVWVPWVSTHRGLRVVRVADGLQSPDPAMPPASGVFSQPFVLGGDGDAALLLLRHRHRSTDRLVVMRVGFDRGAVGAELTAGEVQTVRAGAEPVALVMAREATAQGEVNVMRAWRFHMSTALTLAGKTFAERVSALPAGSVRAGAPLVVGRGRFEVSPLAPGADAVLMQTVLGAERGTVRVGWFPPTGEPEALTLPFAAQALGSAVADGAHAVHITWWDEHNVPLRARVTPDGIHDVERIGAAEATARVAQQTARDTRVVWCGPTAWTVRARAVDGRLRFRAWPTGCVREPTP